MFEIFGIWNIVGVSTLDFTRKVATMHVAFLQARQLELLHVKREACQVEIKTSHVEICIHEQTDRCSR